MLPINQTRMGKSRLTFPEARSRLLSTQRGHSDDYAAGSWHSCDRQKLGRHGITQLRAGQNKPPRLLSVRNRDTAHRAFVCRYQLGLDESR